MPTKKKRIGHAPMWPDYFQFEFPDRTLAILDGHNLFIEGGEYLKVETFVDLVGLLFEKNLMVFVESLTNEAIFPWLADCVISEKHRVLCNKDGIATSIRLYDGRSSRWIVPASTWGRHVNDDLLPSMRATYKHFGVGVKPTPGSLGRAYMRASWAKYKLLRHTGLNILCQNFLWKHRIGGRCYVQNVGDFFLSLIELDMSSAYLAHSMKLPTGTARKFLYNDCWHFATFFCECIVTIHQELPLGPFPVKKKGNNIEYPTRKGLYQTYLWREQIEDALSVGCTVVIRGGYGWDSFTDDFTCFARDIYQLRVTAETDAIEKDTKQVTVSALGSFGMNCTFYTLVSGLIADEHEPCLADKDGGYDFYIRETHDYTRPAMAHFFSYILMQCARTLYFIALPYAKDGRLIMMNYDSVLVTEGDEDKKYVQKHTIEAKMCEMKDLRWQRLTNVTILGNRSLTCDQKVVTPGVSHELEEAS